jgi:hypothetical protein
MGWRKRLIGSQSVKRMASGLAATYRYDGAKTVRRRKRYILVDTTELVIKALVAVAGSSWSPEGDPGSRPELSAPAPSVDR